MAIIPRNKVYYLRKARPRRFASVESRAVVWVSLKTDSRTIAEQKAGEVWSNLVEAWEAKLAGDDADAIKRFEAARELADLRGFRYMTAERVAKLPADELIKRALAIIGRDGKPDKREAAAVLGTVPEPGIAVEKALELYWSLTRDHLRGKSPDQIRRWENPRKKAIASFVRVVGNKELAALTRDDMLDFRDYLQGRIDGEGLSPGSANKDMGAVEHILKVVNQRKRLGIDLPVGDLKFKEGEKHTRKGFSVEWIKEKLLAPGALDGLNIEARSILLGMVNTGARPSELAGLLPDHIRLDDPIPHISIEAVGRQLKSQYARRKIPLTGVSLDAFKACPKGFPRYQGSSASLSATINKYLRENGLCETPEHTLYGLRHAFEDRMRRAKIDDRIRRDLFGHRLDRATYGGTSLEELHEELSKIAL